MLSFGTLKLDIVREKKIMWDYNAVFGTLKLDTIRKKNVGL